MDGNGFKVKVTEAKLFQGPKKPDKGWTGCLSKRNSCAMNPPSPGEVVKCFAGATEILHGAFSQVSLLL